MSTTTIRQTVYGNEPMAVHCEVGESPPWSQLTITAPGCSIILELPNGHLRTIMANIGIRLAAIALAEGKP